MQGPGRLHRAVLVARPHPDGPHRLLAVRRVRPATRISAHALVPGATSRTGGRKAKRTAFSGSSPDSRTRSGRLPRWLSTTTASWASARSRRRTTSGSSWIAAVAIGAVPDRCAQCPAASISSRPSVAVTVNVRSVCSPGGGTGARSCRSVARSVPGATHSSAVRNTNPICRSGSFPVSHTRRSRWPARLSTTTWSSARSLSAVRSELGSSRSRTGTSTAAAEVSWISRTTASEAVVGRVRVRADGQVALGTLAGRGRRRRDLHVHGRAAVRWRFGHLGVEGEPDDPFVVGAGHRVAPRVVAAAVVEVHGEPPVHRVLDADDGRLGPDPGRPADSRDDQRDLGVGVHALVALGSQAQPQPDALRDDQRSRPDLEADPHRRAVAGQQPGLRHRDRQPGRRRDELDAVPLDDRRRVGELQLDTPPAGALEDDVAVGHRHLRWQRRRLPQWGDGRRVVVGGVAGTRFPMTAVAAGSGDAAAAAGGGRAVGRRPGAAPPAGRRPVGPLRGGAPHEVAAGRAELDAGRAGLTALGAHALRHATPRRTASRGDVARGAVVRVASMHTSWTDGPPGARTCSRYFRPRAPGERITSRARGRLDVPFGRAVGSASGTAPARRFRRPIPRRADHLSGSEPADVPFVRCHTPIRFSQLLGRV